MKLVLNAQFNTQLAFPFKEFYSQDQTSSKKSDYKIKGQVVPFYGKMNGEFYWVCNECGKPILDKQGKPINDVYNISEFNEKIIDVEKKNNFVVTAYWVEKLEQLLNDILLKVRPTVDECLKDHILDHFSLYTYHTTKLEDLISNIKTILQNIYKNISYSLKLLNKNIVLGYVNIDKINENTYNKYYKEIDEYLSGKENKHLYPYDISWGLLNKYPEVLEKYKEALSEEIISELKNTYGSFINKLKNNIGLQGRTIGKEKILLPLCDECGEDRRYYCDEEGCDYHTSDEDEIVEVENKKWEDGKYIKEYIYYCPDHGVVCESCNNGLLKDDAIEHNGDWYHNECFYETYGICDNCGNTVYREDLYYDENAGVEYCADCYREDSDVESGTENDISRIEKTQAQTLLDQMPKLYPLEEKTIELSILPTLELASKKFLSSKRPINELRDFINKRLQKEDARVAVNSEMDRFINHDIINMEEQDVPDGVVNIINKEQFQLIIDSFKKQLAELKSFKEKYPNIKGFKPIPVNVKIEKSRMGHEGSVFALYPTEEFLIRAEKMQPGAKSAYNDYIKHMGHHGGALGYARFSVSRGKIIVDNLQTDIDVQGFDENLLAETPALRWWVSSIKKFWAPYLLDALSRFGKQIEKEVYLTTYEMQKIKWHRIPERNKDVYDRIPELMGFEVEEVKAKPEDLKYKEWNMRKVARSLDMGAFAYYNLCRET